MTTRYPAMIRWLHWATVLAVLAMLVLGTWITAFEPADEATKRLLYNLHESTGVSVLVLVVVRLLARGAHRLPPLPPTMPAGLRLAARTNQAALYAMLMVQPVIGLWDSNAWGFPLVWYGLVRIPFPVGQQPRPVALSLSALHLYGVWVLLALIALHLAGVAYHGLKRRDGVVRRMW